MLSFCIEARPCFCYPQIDSAASQPTSRAPLRGQPYHFLLGRLPLIGIHLPSYDQNGRDDDLGAPFLSASLRISPASSWGDDRASRSSLCLLFSRLWSSCFWKAMIYQDRWVIVARAESISKTESPTIRASSQSLTLHGWATCQVGPSGISSLAVGLDLAWG